MADDERLLAEWDHELNTADPRTMARGSRAHAWWRCRRDSSHGPWYAIVNSRTSGGSGCPACARIARRDTIADDLVLGPQWAADLNEGLDPAQIARHSVASYWWRCAAGHTWSTTATVRAQGSGCPECWTGDHSKLEFILAAELADFTEVIFPVPRMNLGDSGRPVYVDLLLPRQRLIIEADGLYYHQGREAEDLHKTQRLQADDWRVLRVRPRPLKPLTDLDVTVTPGATKGAVNAVLSRLAVLDPNLTDIGAYLGRYALTHKQAALTAWSEYRSRAQRPSQPAA